MSLAPRRLALMTIILLVAIVNIIATHQTLTEPFPGHNDFLSRWEGARSYWQDGLNPYGDEASLNIQTAIYGRAVVEGEDPGFFAYPFYTALLLAPIVTVNYAWASAIWMVLLEAVLIIALIIILDIFRYRPSPLILGALILFAVISYFPARGLILGQPGLLVYFLQVVAIWAILRQRDHLAGVALAISTLKPQMGYILVPIILLWALWQRRFHIIIPFVAVFGALMGISFLLVPTWMSDWLGQVSIYTTYTEIGSPIWIISHFPWLAVDPDTEKWRLFSDNGYFIEAIITLVFYAYLLWIWFDVVYRKHTERWFWAITMTLVITHFVAPRTATPHFVVFTIPLVHFIRTIAPRPRPFNRTLIAVAFLTVVFIGQWVHFLTTVVGEFEHPTLYLPTPIVVIAWMIVSRKQWWSDPNLQLEQEGQSA